MLDLPVKRRILVLCWPGGWRDLCDVATLSPSFAIQHPSLRYSISDPIMKTGLHSVALCLLMMGAVHAQDSPMAEQLMAMTNAIRVAHTLGAVTWDAAKAKQLQAYADSCPGFKHSGISGFENLATFVPCATEADCLKDPGASWLWYDKEEEKWDYPASTCNGNWAVCGHFSNMMGPGVTAIGCGWSTCGGSQSNVWCQYTGNPESNPKVPQRTIAKTALLEQLKSGNSAVPTSAPPAPSPALTTASPLPVPTTSRPSPVPTTSLPAPASTSSQQRPYPTDEPTPSNVPTTAPSVPFPSSPVPSASGRYTKRPRKSRWSHGNRANRTAWGFEDIDH